MKGKRKCSDHIVNITLIFISPAQTTEKWGEEEMLAFPLRKNKNILKGKNIFP
jgi:hypothetical protein